MNLTDATQPRFPKIEITFLTRWTWWGIVMCFVVLIAVGFVRYLLRYPQIEPVSDDIDI